ncbi:MAG TPA: bis(5'-nucleosyl)-tetraphosphatase (symmetrical) YqeK [Bacillota bacterium]|nr:bis(5'-nucleosyl)-tetraphosphatase (symmetrical) YqeK [Bacillota bacterium]
MERAEALIHLKPHLTDDRYEHTLRVTDTALELAHLHHAPEAKVELAAIFHDYAKYRSLKEMKRWIQKSRLPKDLLHYHHELWHGPVGALLIERELGIDDHFIQQAIHYHTTGKAHMTTIEMIVFVADYIEPGRDFPGLDEVRKIAREDLVRAAWLISRNTIQFLLSKNSKIYPDTFHAYNDLTERIHGGT